MSSVSPQLLQDFDNLALSLGLTPALDDHGEVVPIGEPEGGKKLVYVVWVGRAIGLFHNWGLASAMTTGFSGSSYKGYATLQQARTAWYQGPTASQGPWNVPAPRPAMLTANRCLRVPRDGHAQDLPPDDPVDTAPHPPPHIPAALRPSDSDDEYWHDEDTSISVRPPHNPDSVDAWSSAISSISSLSLSDASPSLSTGAPATLRPLPAAAVLPPTRASPVSSTANARRMKPLINPRTSAPSRAPQHALTAARSQVQSETRPETHPPDRRRPPASSPARSSSSSAGRSSVASISSSAQGSVSVSKPKDIFVVVRGDKPGLYLDRDTAIFMAGPKLGTKVVAFKSMSKATKYFTEECMAGKVGVPTMASGKSL